MESSAQIRYRKIVEAHKNHDLQTVRELAEEAKQSLLRKDLVQALPAFTWIKKEWLNKALLEGIVVKIGDEYHFNAVVYEESNITGYRGRTPIVDGIKSKVDISKLLDFLKRYKEFEEGDGSGDNE